MSEARTVSPTLEERLAAALLETVRNFYAPESWMDGSWAESEMLSDVRAHATPYLLVVAKEHGLVIGEGELDAAWREAEEALPEGGGLYLSLRPHGRGWIAGAHGWPVGEGMTVGAVEVRDDPPSISTGPATLRALAARLRDSGTPTASESDPEYMCPNCVTPWKCNGPHILEGRTNAERDSRR